MLLSILAGAVVGGLAGFLLFTPQGRRFRRELQPQLEEIATEMRNLQQTASRVRDTATESWRQMETLVGELGQAGSSWANDSRRH
jgi:gas vesicle protein